MGRIDVILPDDMERRLRMEVGRRMGAKRGALTEAIMEEAWIGNDEQTKVKKK